MATSLPETLLNELPDAVLVVDEAGFAQFANTVARGLFGSGIVGKQVGVPVDDFAILQLPRRSGHLTVELRVADASDWKPGCKAVVLRDVSERDRLKRDLQERVFELGQLAALLDAAPAPIARVLEDGTVTWRNMAFVRAFGIAESLNDVLPLAAEPDKWRALLPTDGEAQRPESELRDGGVRSAVFEPLDPTGFPLMLAVVPLTHNEFGARDSGIVVSYTGDQEHLLTDYLRAAFYDSEVGIPNRRGLGLQVERDWPSHQDAHAIVTVEFQAIDHRDKIALFQRIVPATRVALQEVLQSNRDRGLLKGLQDMRMGRLDPQTLGVVLTADSEAGTELAELAQVLAKNLAASSADRLFIGVVLRAEDAEDVWMAFDWGLLAVETAREQGEVVHVFEQTDSARLTERAALTARIRDAIVNESFTIAFQPRIDLATGGLTSVEVLARLDDPELGEISPMQFVPILRRLGLVTELTRIIARKVLDQVQAWAAEGRPPIKISLNIVPDDLSSGRVLELIQQLSDQLGEGHALELELAEQDLFAGRTHGRLKALLDNMGIELSLDDFGTGYSTFTYLSTLPISCIKVDKSVADDLLVPVHRRASIAMYRSIVALAHELGIIVCAEGLESQAQVDDVRLLGIDEVQGYVFSRPLRADVFAATYLT